MFGMIQIFEKGSDYKIVKPNLSSPKNQVLVCFYLIPRFF